MARAWMIVGFATLVALAWPRLAPLREAVAGLLAPEVEAGRYAEAVVEGLRDGPDAGAPYAPPEGDFAALSFVADGAARRWHLQAPRPADALPAAIVLLHGAPGRDGRAMLDMWRGAGDVLLIAPDSADPRGWSGAADGPAFMAALLEDAARVHPFDLERVFLMGHSAGAIQATGLANRDGPWRAVAIHGGILPGERMRPRADGPPVLVQIGDGDALFPLPGALADAAALSQAGHDVTVEVIAGHGHWYYEHGPRLAARSLAFFARHGL